LQNILENIGKNMNMKILLRLQQCTVQYSYIVQ
jgi:hypothetical protein